MNGRTIFFLTILAIIGISLFFAQSILSGYSTALVSRGAVSLASSTSSTIFLDSYSPRPNGIFSRGEDSFEILAPADFAFQTTVLPQDMKSLDVYVDGSSISLKRMSVYPNALGKGVHLVRTGVFPDSFPNGVHNLLVKAQRGSQLDSFSISYRSDFDSPAVESLTNESDQLVVHALDDQAIQKVEVFRYDEKGNPLLVRALKTSSSGSFTTPLAGLNLSSIFVKVTDTGFNTALAVPVVSDQKIVGQDLGWASLKRLQPSLPVSLATGSASGSIGKMFQLSAGSCKLPIRLIGIFWYYDNGPGPDGYAANKAHGQKNLDDARAAIMAGLTGEYPSINNALAGDSYQPWVPQITETLVGLNWSTYFQQQSDFVIWPGNGDSIQSPSVPEFKYATVLMSDYSVEKKTRDLALITDMGAGASYPVVVVDWIDQHLKKNKTFKPQCAYTDLIDSYMVLGINDCDPINMIVAHEFGHAFGLSHYPDTTNLMLPGGSEHPKKDLLPNQITAIEAHLCGISTDHKLTFFEQSGKIGGNIYLGETISAAPYTLCGDGQVGKGEFCENSLKMIGNQCVKAHDAGDPSVPGWPGVEVCLPDCTCAAPSGSEGASPNPGTVVSPGTSSSGGSGSVSHPSTQGPFPSRKNQTQAACDVVAGADCGLSTHQDYCNEGDTCEKCFCTSSVCTESGVGIISVDDGSSPTATAGCISKGGSSCPGADGDGCGFQATNDPSATNGKRCACQSQT